MGGYTMKITKNIFPQFIEDAKIAETVKTDRSDSDKSLEYMYTSDMVEFIKASYIKSFKQSKNGIEYVICADKYLNRTVMTHETVMNQMIKKKNEDAVEINVCIDVWSEDIVRIRYGTGSLERKETLPKEQRMLTGKPKRNIKFTVTDNENLITLSTKKIVINIDKSSSVISVYDSNGEYITKQARYAIMPTDAVGMAICFDKNDTACFEGYELTSKEQIYGLGERFDHVNRRGIKTDFWNKDAFGTSNTRTYINVPFVVSTSGYGIFLNSTAKTQWDIATKEASTLSFCTLEPVMDYFLITGKNIKQIIYNYCTLTGFSPIPPIWSFGLWMSRNSYLSWDVVFDVAKNIRLKEIPCDVLHLDTAWFKDDWNCDLRFSKERFPQPRENIKKLNDQGFKISAWQYNFIPPREDNENYVEAREKGYLALDKNGNIFKHSNDLPGSWKDDSIIDFSNQDACQWYASMIKNVIRTGISAIKTDFGEGIPEDAVYKNIEGTKFHNNYSLTYNSVVFNACKEITNENLVWARSGTAGSQRYPIHWGGDSQCTFEGLQGTIRAGLSLGLSGFVFFSHDIGGFIGRPTPELYIRWAQVGLFSSHSRCHGGGNNNSREPWSFGDEANRIFKKYANLRYSLLPYIISEANYCAKNAVPMMKAMLLDYESDLNTYNIDDQYMFGNSLLVAPILESLEKKKIRNIYLPKGIWYDYWTKKKIISKGEWIQVSVTLDIMPIFVKNGSILSYKEYGKQNTEESIYPIKRIESYGKNSSYVVTDGKEQLLIKVKNGKLISSISNEVEFLSIL